MVASEVVRGPLDRLRRGWVRSESRVVPYVYIAPFFVLFAVFGVFTIGYTAWVSLHDWHIFGDRSFVGLENYRRLLTDPRFTRAVANTFSILVLSTLPQLVMALGLAEVLNDRRLRAAHAFRSALLVPNITSIVAVVIVFESVFGRTYGLLNGLLQTVGLDAVNWHASRLGSHVAIATMVNWRWTGYNTLIFLAALQGVPRELHEAALVDGANRFQRFARISLPLLRPAVLFALILSVIGGLQLFTEPLMFGSGVSSSGGSDNQYLTVTLYLYTQAFRQFRFGYASAIAWALFLLIALTALVALLVVHRTSGERPRRTRSEVAS